MKIRAKITACTLAFALIITSLMLIVSADTDTLTLAAQYLYSVCLDESDDWSIFSLARSGLYDISDDVFTQYLTEISDYIDENADSDGKLSSTKSTENSRIIIAVSALGVDCSTYFNVDITAPLSDFDYVKKQGVNAVAFGLLALDTRGYLADSEIREEYIQYLLDCELDATGWAFSGSVPDPDMTGAVLAALAPYTDDDEVAAAVERGISALEKLQQDDGTFASWGTVNCESCAWAVVGLCAVGVNPDTDERFIKNGVSALDAMLSFMLSDGSFSHISGGTTNLMATQQALYALDAFERFESGSSPLFMCVDEDVFELLSRFVTLFKLLIYMLTMIFR